jgi:hypothetical protein
MAQVALRWMLTAHRYLGIAIGVLMVIWCLSGAVMMYVPYPQLTEAERVNHLAPIDWHGCCVVAASESEPNAPVLKFQLEEIDGHPALRVRLANGAVRLWDLRQGKLINEVSEIRAAAVASGYWETGALGAKPTLLDTITYDQWTVQGASQPNRPLFRFALNDDASTEVYVSSRDGSAVQITTGQTRFWNWLGSVPHWLYVPALRSRPIAWTRTVVWISTLGCFLTLTGLFAGIVQLRKGANGRWVPYRGFHYWHHVLGLVFGLFVLTWVASGLISMNPWGLLEGEGFEEPMRLRGTAPTLSEVLHSVRALPTAALDKKIVAIESAPLNGHLFLVATRSDGRRLRLNATGAAQPLEQSDLTYIGTTLKADRPVLIDREDDYYFSHHRDRTQLPAYRAVAAGPTGNRYYLDSISGLIIARFDSDGRAYRWLHQGLHRLDFSPAVRAHPLWDVLTLTLLSGVTVTCGLGTYLGIRSLRR